MSVRRIVQSARSGGSPAEDAVLRTPARKVEVFDRSLVRLVGDLSDTMWAHPICVGLAAPQIAVSAAVFVANWRREDRSEDLVAVNPEVLSTSGKKDRKRESCMSVWGLTGEVERREKITLRFQDVHGATCERTFEGFAARVVHHEVAHLQGVLFADQLRPGAELAPTPLFDGLVNADGVE